MERTRNSGRMARSRAGSVLIYLMGILLIGSASAKLALVPQVVSLLGSMGFDGNRLVVIALLEIASAGLVLIPTTRSFGLLMVSSYMGGAIATDLGHGQGVIRPGFVLALLWLGVWLKHPEMLWSFAR